MVSIVFVVVALGGFYGAFYLWVWRARRREKNLSQHAARYGLVYFADDPFGLDWLDLPLFQEDDQVAFSNVVIGERDGLPFKAAEFTSYYREIDTGGPVKYIERRAYSIMVAELDMRMRLPTTVIVPETLRTLIPGALGKRDLQFELREFNDRFHITSHDRRFAYHLIDQRMMQHLLGESDNYLRYEVRGSRLLVALPREKANVILRDVPRLFAAVSGFAGHIPRVVWSEHGATPQTPHRPLRRARTGGGSW
jgi:uncharacterized protein DUF3137